MREQKGSIIQRSGRWYVTYWEQRNVNGTAERRRVTHYLGEKTTRGKHPSGDIEDECKSFMSIVNASNKAVQPEHVVTIVQFVDTIYMPWVEANKRPSTAHGYRQIWKANLAPHFGGMLLRDYRPSHATRFLTSLAEKGLGLNAVNHTRALMSGIFRHAASLGYIDSNPIQLAKLLVAPAQPKDTPHYTVEEMAAALAVLEDKPQAKAAMALAFIGLRPSEIRGLRQEDVDLDARMLHIRRSVWHDSVSDGGKSKNSARDLALGSEITGILRDYIQAHPSRSGFVLENSASRSLSLDALARDVIRPTFAAAGLVWKSYYGGRRGAETEMNRYTNGNSQVTSHYFGHSKAVADDYYIKPIPEETKIAALALDSALQETIGRLNRGTIN
jgi:integrase